MGACSLIATLATRIAPEAVVPNLRALMPAGMRQAVELGVEIGEYRGVVTAPKGVFRRLLPERPTPQKCVEAYYLQRTR